MPRRLPLLLIALLGAAAHAQPTAPTADRFTHLGVGDGLSQSNVTAILQDRDGFLWFGTDDGLNRYDGVSFTVYRHANGDSTSLGSSRVLDLHEDRGGALWVATQGGIQRYDRQTGTFRAPRGGAGTAGSACGTIVRAILETPDGALWTGALTGQVCRRDAPEAAFALVPRRGGPEAQSLQSLVLAPDGAVWVSGGPTACRVAPGARTCEPPRGTPPKTFPVYASADLGMVGTADAGSAVASGLVRREGDAWGSLGTVEGTRISVGPHVADAVNGTLWIGTESSGVLVLDPASGETTRIRPEATVGSGLVDPTVNVVYRDREGAVWLGTSDGVSRWDGRAERFALYRSRGGLSSDRVNGMHVAADGTVWVGTTDGLNRLRPEAGDVRVYRRPASGASAHPNAFWRVYEDARGRVVVGSRREGIFVVDTASGTFRRDAALDALVAPLAKRPATTAIRYIGEDRSGRTWVGVETGAAVRDRDGAVRVYPSRTERLTAHRVNVVYEDREGGVWLGTDAGICRLDEGADRFYCLTQSEGLSAEVSWTLAESSATPDVVWAGMIGGGLCRIGRHDLAVACPDLGLPSDVIYGILPDASGALWLTTTSGLVRYDPASGSVRRYTEADGLQSDEFDLMAFAQGPGGWMVVGGRKGLNRFHPGRLRQRTGAPPVWVTGVRVLGQPRPGLPGDRLRLEPDETVFSIEFAALDYTDPRNNRYRYRLRGFDDAWRETDGRRPTATYTRVPPGDYTFEVVGSNHDGVFSSAPARLGVEVRPAWWQRSDLRLGAGALVLGGVVLGVAGGVRRRVRRAEAERAEQVGLQRRLAESRERERYRIARDLHDGPVQGLYRLGHQLDRATMRGDAASVEAAREQVNAVADELRDVLRALRPPVIEHLGVGPALSSLLRTFRRAHPEVEVRDGVEAVGRGWPVEVQHALYRVAQEALSNVEKHAAPTTLTVRLEADATHARLDVEDDGQGFAVPDLADLARADHFGLIGIVERIESLGGRVRLDSRPGGSTRLVAEVPLPEAVATGHTASGAKTVRSDHTSPAGVPDPSGPKTPHA